MFLQGKILIVKREVRVFRSMKEADEADRIYYRSLTPEQRFAIALQLIDDYYGTQHRLERVVRIVPKKQR